MGGILISVNGTINVPKHKPDIESILRLSTAAVIDKTKTLRKKIVFCGHVIVSVEYVACSADCSQPIHFLHCEVPFNGLLLHRHARECLKALVKAKVRFIDTHIIDPRTIDNILIVKVRKLKLHRVSKCKPVHFDKCKPICCNTLQHFCDTKSQLNCVTKPQNSCNCGQPPACDNKQHSVCDDKPKHCCDKEPPAESKTPFCDVSTSPAKHYDSPPSYNPSGQPALHGYGGNKPHNMSCSDTGPCADFYLPTLIQPFKRMGKSYGTNLGYDRTNTHYQE